MDNLRFLRTKDITPSAVMTSVAEEIHKGEITAVYVIGIEKDGAPSIWASGDLGELCLAATALTEFSHRVLRGEADE